MWTVIASASLAILRDGMHFQTLSPTVPGTVSSNTLVLWINGGPVSPVSYLSDGALQHLADQSELPIAYFDWCGVGRSTCTAASEWSELQGQAREVLEHVRNTPLAQNVVVSMYSAASLTTPRDALAGVAAVVYINPVVDLYSSVASRRRCVREYLDTLVSVMPYRVIDLLGSVVCSSLDDIQMPSLRGVFELMRQTFLRERVAWGYSNAVLRAPGGVSDNCVFVTLSDNDRVIDKAAAVAFHRRSSTANDTFLSIPDTGHYPVIGDCANCDPIATAYVRAASRCFTRGTNITH